VTAVALAGRWSLEREQTRHYAMAQNLATEVRRQYDAALADLDLLVMPTVPMVAPEIPAPDDPLETRVARALEMIVNCAPFDVSGHPATSVPAGLSQGLPVGMMLVGRRFEDTTPLTVAHAFEQLVGGFPSPPVR
jgi:amidase